MSKNSVILWDGHGGYSEEYGSFICTREKLKYHVYSDYKLWVTTGDGEYILTSYAIDTYIKDLSNSFLYFGTCEGLKDNNLLNSFKNKNASALVLNTDVITTSYAGDVMASVISHMVEGENLEQAMQAAKSEYGERDSNLWTDYGALDYSVPTVCFGGDYTFSDTKSSGDVIELLDFYMTTYKNKGNPSVPGGASIVMRDPENEYYSIDGKECFSYFVLDNGSITYYSKIDGVELCGLQPGQNRNVVEQTLSLNGFSKVNNDSMGEITFYELKGNGQASSGHPAPSSVATECELYRKDLNKNNGEYLNLSVEYLGDSIYSVTVGVMYENAG